MSEVSNISVDLDLAATHLEWAWKTGLRLGDLPLGSRPGSLEEAYVAQARFIERTGEKAAGWKIAGASPRGLRGEHPNAPAFGTLIQSRIVDSGGVLIFPVGMTATLETEIAFRFGRSVSPAIERFEQLTMIESAFVAIEVVCSRFINRRAVSQSSFLADNLGFHALVCGDEMDIAVPGAFEDEAGVWRNGTRIAGSLAGDDRTRPYESLRFLWRELAKRNRTIPKGAAVTTGTLSVPVDVECCDVFQAKVGNGIVDVTMKAVDAITPSACAPVESN